MEIYGATNETRRAVKLVFHRFLKNQQDRITKAAKCKIIESTIAAFECSNRENSVTDSGKYFKVLFILHSFAVQPHRSIYFL